jgi:predicted nucleotidyltransferase
LWKGSKNIFLNNPSVLAVFLMGSAAQSKLRSDSDVDIGILLREGVTIPSQELLSMVGDLGYEFGFDFDLGILNSHNLIYSKEAIFKGIQIYNQDEEAINAYRI